MKNQTGLAWAALLVSVLGSGCTFYTACPDNNPGPNNNNQAGSGNGGGTGNTGGPGMVTPVDEATATEWVSAVGNLEGTKSECGNLTTVTVKPDEDWVIAGVARRGLYVSRDGDPDWVPMGQGKDSEALDNRTSQLRFDPDEPATFWQSGIYGAGAYQTTDDGDTFHRLGLVTHVDSIAVDFTDPERKTLIAGGHEGRNVHRSTDAGQTWEDVGPNLPGDAGFTGFAAIIDTQTFLVASFTGSGAGIFRSEDGGDNWASVWQGGIRSQPLFASDGSINWVLSNQDGHQGLVRSEDHGQSWAKVDGSEGILSVENALTELPDGRIATVGFTHLIISADQGKSWREVGKKLPYTPIGVTYSGTRKLFYIWYFVCESGDNPVRADQIMTLAFDYETE